MNELRDKVSSRCYESVRTDSVSLPTMESVTGETLASDKTEWEAGDFSKSDIQMCFYHLNVMV